MTVRAKMVCSAIKETQYGKIVYFSSQYDLSIPEDQRFQKATPSASAEFQIDNPAALEQFAIGKAYYVDFNLTP